MRWNKDAEYTAYVMGHKRASQTELDDRVEERLKKTWKGVAWIGIGMNAKINLGARGRSRRAGAWAVAGTTKIGVGQRPVTMGSGHTHGIWVAAGG